MNAHNNKSEHKNDIVLQLKWRKNEINNGQLNSDSTYKTGKKLNRPNSSGKKIETKRNETESELYLLFQLECKYE